jgi:hypothetical protein
MYEINLVMYICFAVYLGRYWHGLRFLRALIILNTSDVLVYLRLINTSSSIRLTQLVTIFLTVVSTSVTLKCANTTKTRANMSKHVKTSTRNYNLKSRQS